jgi:hypothetical protein
MNYTADQIQNIIAEATQAAHAAQNKFLQEWTEKTGGNQYGEPMYCGFAWVDIYGVKGNTKMGKAMKAAGLRKDWTGKAFQIWNPGNHGGQSMDVKEAGAYAAADVFKKYGFTAYAGSRAD